MAHYVDCGTLSAIQNSFIGTLPGSSSANGSAHYSFQVPSDFSCLESLELMIVGAQGSTNARMCFRSEYAAEGAVASQHASTKSSASYAITTAAVQYINLDCLVGCLAANDNVVIRARREGTSGCDTVTDLLTGSLKLEYS